MIIGKQINELETYGVESKKATINQNSIAKLQYLLTKGLYSDPESAVIVEWTNNGIDSVVQAGKNPIENPVIVKITENSFSVQDFGLGLDKNDFETVCMDYLNSTKENTNEAIGAFGIGLKSFLSLNRSATFTCVKDGYKWKFLAYEGAEFLEYDLISEGITDERNGVLCQIQLNDWREASNFLSKAKEKLAKQIEALMKDKVKHLKASLAAQIQEVNGVQFLATQVELSPEGAKDLAYELGNLGTNLFLVLATADEDKPMLTCYISKELVAAKNLNAGQVVRELGKFIQGGGGGQPFFATAGGKNVAGIAEALTKAVDFIQ
mgnify:CR=1 FL=1